MLEFEPRVRDLKVGESGYVFCGALHVIDGKLWIDTAADAPEERRSDSQVCVMRTTTGMVVNIKETCQIEVRECKANREPIFNKGEGRFIPVDYREIARQIREAQNQKVPPERKQVSTEPVKK